MKIETVLMVIIVLALVTYITSYIMKKKHYKTINKLEQEKFNLIDTPVSETIQSVKDLSLTGQTKKNFEQWKEKWKQLEMTAFPDIENLLFDAEQATDRLRLIKASQAEQKSSELMNSTKQSIKEIQLALNELLKGEEKNNQAIKKVQEMYQSIRKKLLTQSFSFGPALDRLEKKLTFLELSFADFSDLTVSGDHIEAEEVLKKLSHETKELNDAVTTIPSLVKEISTEFPAQVQELKEGYHELKDVQHFVFLEDTIATDIADIEKDIKQGEKLLKQCEPEEVKKLNVMIEEKINHIYDVMEAELNAKETVEKEYTILAEFIGFVNKRNQQLMIEIDRVSQSYKLDDAVLEQTKKMQEKIDEIKLDFETFKSGIEKNQAVYTVVEETYAADGEKLTHIEEEQEKLITQLADLRKEETEVKEKIDDFEFNMRGIKRYIEKQHLPGLPEEYLDLFFVTTERIEKLAKELNKLKIDMTEIKKMCELCEDDVELLIDKTEEIVDSALLTEYMMQYANRYRNEHPEIGEAILESNDLFNKEFQYKDALEVVSTALEVVEPGAFKKVENQYYEEKSQSAK
ncbi:septation ring formation regulator EzrA [Carnobacterium sp. 17-4]|uniref:septation ring formation regulator EzrA n=1 Tax=Carnobacterium sp. (strain 17-4) TaxID=208596 RepID=UPI0002058BD7|nr:septation ring formation regulator EzrA [Carnobacterium sp. 17-4]AEB29524.1 septation ring formation regulator EzrA [Carnobacterium sp. 17-4]